ncbi:hypothetical protein V5799_004133, partial [Amblyomma americanum]
MTSQDPVPLICEEGSQPDSELRKDSPPRPKRDREELRGILSDALYVSSMYQICFADVDCDSSDEDEQEDQEEVSGLCVMCTGDVNAFAAFDRFSWNKCTSFTVRRATYAVTMKSVFGGVWNRIDAGRSFLPASMRYDVIRQHDYGGAGMSSRNLELDPPSNSAYSDDEDTSEEEWQEPKRAEEVKCRSEDEWNFFDNIVQLLGDADTVE